MKIKYTYAIIAGIIGMVMVAGCNSDLLDITPTDRLSDTQLTSDSVLFEDFVINRYLTARLQDKEGEGTNPGFGRGFEYALWASITDEAMYTSNDLTWLIQQGSLAPENTGMAGTIWARSYRSIRECNYALGNIDKVVMSAAHKDLLIAELKFIRAYRYHDLLRNYGRIPLMGDKVYQLTDNMTDPSLFEKAPIAESVDYIVGQLDEAAAGLPETNDSKNWQLGRATKGAARALKARILLYGASPLYDGAATWPEAAAAAKAVMDMGKYTLHSDYEDLFHTATSNETIFERVYTVGARHVCLEISNGPNGSGGWGGNAPLQNLVDDYEVKVDANTAVPFDWNNATHAQAPYANRDPRFYATVYHNGAMFRGRALETFLPGGKDSKDGPDTWNSSKTGYYLRKFTDVNLPISNPWDVAGIQPWIYMRYAEVLLNYAEAQNEAVGPDGTVYDAINQVRRRADMPDLPGGLTKDQMREAIRHERRVELAYEEHRFYDVRRWKIAMQTENEPAYGITITKDGNNLTYAKTVSLVRKFEEKHYWLPIPRPEILSSNNQLEQNPFY